MRDCACAHSVMSHLAIPCTLAYQAPLSMGFPRQEHLSGLPFPTPGDLPNPGVEPASLMSPALAGRFLTTSATWEAILFYEQLQNDNRSGKYYVRLTS